MNQYIKKVVTNLVVSAKVIDLVPQNPETQIEIKVLNFVDPFKTTSHEQFSSSIVEVYERITALFHPPGLFRKDFLLNR